MYWPKGHSFIISGLYNVNQLMKRIVFRGKIRSPRRRGQGSYVLSMTLSLCLQTLSSLLPVFLEALPLVVRCLSQIRSDTLLIQAQEEREEGYSQALRQS